MQINSSRIGITSKSVMDVSVPDRKNVLLCERLMWFSASAAMKFRMFFEQLPHGREVSFDNITLLG